MKKNITFGVITLIAMMQSSPVWAISTEKHTFWSRFTDYAGSGLVLAGAVIISVVIVNTLRNKNTSNDNQ